MAPRAPGGGLAGSAGMAGAGALAFVVLDNAGELLGHGDLGVLTFGVLVVALAFFGYLTARLWARRRP